MSNTNESEKSQSKRTLATLMSLQDSNPKYSMYVYRNGIQSAGSVKIYKSWITNLSLSPEARALLITLMNYKFSDDRSSVMPSILTLKKILHIGRDKYRRALTELVMQGFVVAKTDKTLKTKYKKIRHRYTLLEKCFDESKGYGFVPRTVLYDPRLNYHSKLLYGILSSYASVNNDIVPDVYHLCSYLDCCNKSYQSYITKLKSFGYINVGTKRDARNWFSGNLYFFIAGKPKPQGKREVRKNHVNVTKPVLPDYIKELHLNGEEMKALFKGETFLVHPRRGTDGLTPENINDLFNKYKGEDGHLQKDVLISAAESYLRYKTTPHNNSPMPDGTTGGTIEYLPGYFGKILLNELRRREGELILIQSREEKRMNNVRGSNLSEDPSFDSLENDPIIQQILKKIKTEEVN